MKASAGEAAGKGSRQSLGNNDPVYIPSDLDLKN
jgi:hypothetical protein